MQWARQFPKHLGIRFKKWRWLHNMKSWEEIKVWGGKWTSYEYLIRTPWTWKCSSKEYMDAVTRDETWLYVHEFLYFVPGSLFERVPPAEIDVSNWENHRTLLQCWIFFFVFFVDFLPGSCWENLLCRARWLWIRVRSLGQRQRMNGTIQFDFYSFNLVFVLISSFYFIHNCE